jgi:hypothetical protein
LDRGGQVQKCAHRDKRRGTAQNVTQPHTHAHTHSSLNVMSDANTNVLMIDANTNVDDDAGSTAETVDVSMVDPPPAPLGANAEEGRQFEIRQITNTRVDSEDGQHYCRVRWMPTLEPSRPPSTLITSCRRKGNMWLAQWKPTWEPAAGFRV